MDEIMISIGYSPPKKQKKEKANEWSSIFTWL